MATKLFELERDRASIAEKARKIVTDAIAANRDLTTEEDTRVKAHQEEIRSISRKIELFQLANTFEAADPEERAAGIGLGPELPDLDGKRPYSLLRAINMNVEKRYDGIEGEVHQELAKYKGETPKGVLVPLQLCNPRFAKHRTEARDLTTSAAAGGIANILGTPLIDILRNKMVMQLLGSDVITGLTGGTFSLPKQTAAATAYHTAEAVAAALSNLTLGQVTWTPRTLTAITAITRKTLLQTSLDVEALARRDLMEVLARSFDQTGVNGSGQNNQPLGICQDPAIPTIALGTNGGEPTWAMVLALESSVAVNNAEFGKLAYLTSNQGRANLKNTTKVASSTFPLYIWEPGKGQGEGEINSYRAVASQQVPTGITKGSATTCTSLIYGNFESALYGLWSGMDILTDPYSRGGAGSILIYMYQDYDFQFRYEQSFAKCNDMLIS